MVKGKIYFKRIRGIIIIAAIIYIIFNIFSVKNDSGETVLMRLSSESGDDILSAPEYLDYSYRMRGGMTLENILNNETVRSDDKADIVKGTGKIFDMKKFRAGNYISVKYDQNGLKSIRYEIDYRSFLTISRESGKFKAKIIVLPVISKVSEISGIITDSLFQAVLSIGETGELADIMADLFEYDVDFNRDIRSGDKFDVLIEKRFVNSKFAGYGKLIAAKFVNRERLIKLARFKSGKGTYSYFHPSGKAVRKMFLRCPLPFMRVTSGFGFRRHPVLKFSANHNGVDFGAPRGTSVRVSGSGTIIRSGYSSVKGRYIIVSHRNSYQTHYYHLSRIKKGIRRGVHVNQGAVIGYVGSTGRSTGPHLHYGIRRGKYFLNPLRFKPPSKSSVPDKFLKKFKLYVSTLFFLMDRDNKSLLSKLLLNFFANAEIGNV